MFSGASRSAIRRSPTSHARLKRASRLPNSALKFDATGAQLRVSWAGCKETCPVSELTNESITFTAPGAAVGGVLRAVKVCRGHQTIIDNITLIVQTRLRRQVHAAIRADRSLGPSLSEDEAQCAEVLLRAARTGSVRLRSADGSSSAECLAIGLEPHSRRLTIRANGEGIFGEGEVVDGSFVLDRVSYRFASEAVRSAPLLLRWPAMVDVAWESGEPRWFASSGGDLTAIFVSALLSKPQPHRLHDLGVDDLSFDFDAEHELFPSGLLLPEIILNLYGIHLTVAGEVSSVRAVTGSVMRCNVHIRHDASQRELLRDWLARQSANQTSAGTAEGVRVERLDDPIRIRELVSVMARLRVSPSVKWNTDEGEAISIASMTLDGDSIKWPIPMRPTATVSLTRHNSVYSFKIGQVSSDAFHSALPRSILHIRQRWFRRAPVSPDEGLRFGRWPLCDLSHGGFSFQFDATSESYESGTILRRACVNVGDRSVYFDVEICAVERVSTGVICRVRAVPCTAEDRITWESIVESKLHPNTKIGAEWAEGLWTLYQQSGYFSLSGKEPSTFESLKPAFVSVFGKLDRARHLGCHVVFPSAAIGVVGALSALKVYSRSWLGFQMAKIKGDTPEGASGRSVLRDIHHAIYERIQLDPEAKWLIAYPQVKPVWSRLAHHDLPQRFVDRGEACIVRFQAVEIAARTLLEDEDVGDATEEEIALLLSRLSLIRPRAYLEALDLTAPQYDLGANKTAWRAAGLGRERAVLISRQQGKPIAAAVMEVAEDGTHLFRLLDLVRLFPLANGAEQQYPRLLNQAGRWFARQGKERFVLFREEGTEVDLSSCDVVQDMGLADMSVLSVARLPELLEYVEEITAPSVSTPHTIEMARVADRR